MRTGRDWGDHVKGILKGEPVRQHVTYEQISAKLNEIGVEETPEAIANKISRKRFTAVFLAQCPKDLGLHTLRLRKIGMPHRSNRTKLLQTAAIVSAKPESRRRNRFVLTSP